MIQLYNEFDCIKTNQLKIKLMLTINHKKWDCLINMKDIKAQIPNY